MKGKFSIKIVKGLIWSLLGLSTFIFILSCNKEEENIGLREIKFKIAADRTSLTQTEAVVYSDSSKDVSDRAWTFEGGSLSSSVNEGETVTYSEPGKFATTLNVTFTDGTSENRLIYVEVEPFVATEFEASATTVVFGSEVTFTNLTENIPDVNSFPDGPRFEEELDTWVWEFEGGVPSTSTEKEPVVRYPNTGTFKVKLTANRNYPTHTNVLEKTSYIDVVDVAVISPTSIYTCDFGNTVRLEYEEPLTAPPAEALNVFTLLADDAIVEVSSLELDPNNANSLIFNLANPITDGQDVTLDYNSADPITAQSGSIFAPLEGAIVENRSVTLFIGNMDFENGDVSAFPPDWGTWNPTQMKNNNEFYMVVDDAGAPSGSQSLMWNYDGSEDVWILDNKTPTSVIVDGDYRVVFNAKSSLDGAILDLRVIESGWATSNDPADFTLSTDWQEFSFDFTANDAGDQNRKIWWQTPPNTESFDMHVDNIRIYYLGCE